MGGSCTGSGVESLQLSWSLLLAPWGSLRGPSTQTQGPWGVWLQTIGSDNLLNFLNEERSLR